VPCDVSAGSGSGSGSGSLAGVLSSALKAQKESGGVARATVTSTSPQTETKRPATPTRARSNTANTTRTPQSKALPQYASPSPATHKTFGPPLKQPVSAIPRTPISVRKIGKETAGVKEKGGGKEQGGGKASQQQPKAATGGLQRYGTPTRASKQLHATPPSKARQGLAQGRGLGQGQGVATTPKGKDVMEAKARDAERDGNRYGTPPRHNKERCPTPRLYSLLCSITIERQYLLNA
jgi:hypothetical protein